MVLTGRAVLHVEVVPTLALLLIVGAARLIGSPDLRVTRALLIGWIIFDAARSDKLLVGGYPQFLAIMLTPPPYVGLVLQIRFVALEDTFPAEVATVLVFSLFVHYEFANVANETSLADLVFSRYLSNWVGHSYIWRFIVILSKCCCILTIFCSVGACVVHDLLILDVVYADLFEDLIVLLITLRALFWFWWSFLWGGAVVWGSFLINYWYLIDDWPFLNYDLLFCHFLLFLFHLFFQSPAELLVHLLFEDLVVDLCVRELLRCHLLLVVVVRYVLLLVHIFIFV